jgi:hypothetical protein
MITVMRWLIRRTGRRGASLAFLMVLDLAYGYSLLVAPALRATDLLLPRVVWAWIWLGMAAVCATGVLVSWDRWQITGMAMLLLAWSGVNAEAWIVHGVPLGWVSAVVWLVFALFVLVIGSWPEPPPPPVPAHPVRFDV